MNINVNSGKLNVKSFNRGNNKKILLLGPGINNNKAREIILPFDEDEVLSLYGNSELYSAFKTLKTFADLMTVSDNVSHMMFKKTNPLFIEARFSLFIRLLEE